MWCEVSAYKMGIMRPNNLILFTTPGHKLYVQLVPLGYLEWTNFINTLVERLIPNPKQ
jgi:hypothetical protein